MTYIPDRWCILKITSDDPHYKVFGSWRGSYTTADEWRMNSGIIKVEYSKEMQTYLFFGHSGSIYKCHNHRYGTTNFGHSVLHDFMERAKGQIEVMPEETDWLEIDYVFSKN